MQTEIYLKIFQKNLAGFIPKEKTVNKSDTERRLIGSRAEGNNPRAIYCYDVHRNGKKEDGSLNKRSIENSNKAESLCPELYERFRDETNLSFFFSEDEEDKKSNEEIMAAFVAR